MTERLHHRLKALMKDKGLTQRELAIKTGLTEASVSKYLSGLRVPHMDALVVLARALDTETDYLLGIKNEGKSKYQIIEKAIKENKNGLTSEERMNLIILLSKDK